MRIVPPIQLTRPKSRRDSAVAPARPASWSFGRLADQILGCLPRARPGAPTLAVPVPPLPGREAPPASPQAPAAVPTDPVRQLPSAHLADSCAILSAILNVDFFALLAETHPNGVGDMAQLTAQVRARLAGPQAQESEPTAPLLSGPRLEGLLPHLVKAVAQAYHHHMHDLTLLQRQRARVRLLLPLHLEGYVGRFARPLARQLARLADA